MREAEPNTPEYWRMRAAETSLLAAQMADAVNRMALLKIAKSYERLATLAERGHGKSSS